MLIDLRPGAPQTGSAGQLEFDTLFNALFIEETDIGLIKPPETPVNIRQYFAPAPLASDSRYMAVFSDSRLTFLDCRNPYAVNEVKSIGFNTGASFDGFPQWATSIGNYVYVCSNNGRVHVFDWSNRGDPVRINAATRIFLTGQHYDMASNGVDTLFLANTSNNRFIAIDASDPLNLTQINNVNVGSFAAGVAFYQGYAYCGAFAGSIRVFQFDGSAWVQIANVPSIASTSRLAVGVNSIGDPVIVAQRYNTNEFAIHSLANPALPGPAGILAAPSAVNIYARAFISDGLLHLSTSTGDLVAYNISDPLSPFLVGSYVPEDLNGDRLFDLGLGIEKFKSRGAAFNQREFLLMVGRLNGQTNVTRTVATIPLPLFPDAIRPVTLSDVGGAWKRNTIAIAPSDLINGYVTLSHSPQSEAKTIVSVAEGVDLVVGRDYTVDRPNKRVIFQADMLALITSLFNEHGTLTILVAYFAQD
jgi:hypothetical protein